MSLKSGHRVVPVVGREQDKQSKDFLAYRVGTMRVQPGGLFLPVPFINYATKIYDFEFKTSDVLVMSFPRCGSNWTQEILWTLLHNPDLKNPRATQPLIERSQYLETDSMLYGTNMHPMNSEHPMFQMCVKLYPDITPNQDMFLQVISNMSDPRIMKTHIPFSYLNPNLLDTCKVVYLAREPKDAVVSYYHFSRMLKAHGYVGSLETFVEHFINDTLIFSPFWKSVKDAWKRRNHPNLHFIFYEEMLADPKAELIRLIKFLGLNLDDEKINKIVEYTSFKAMKMRDNILGDEWKASSDNSVTVNVEVMKETGGFFRKGVSGSGRIELGEELEKKIDAWTNRNIDQDLGLDFKYAK